MYDDILGQLRRTCDNAAIEVRFGLDGRGFADWADSSADLCGELYPRLESPREYVEKVRLRPGFNAHILTQGEQVVAGLWVCQIDTRDQQERLRTNPLAVALLKARQQELGVEPDRIFYVVQAHARPGFDQGLLVSGLLAHALSSAVSAGQGNGSPVLAAGRIGITNTAMQSIARRFGAEPTGVYDSASQLHPQGSEYWLSVVRAVALAT
jgi:hypothetical protein